LLVSAGLIALYCGQIRSESPVPKPAAEKQKKQVEDLQLGFRPSLNKNINFYCGDDILLIVWNFFQKGEKDEKEDLWMGIDNGTGVYVLGSLPCQRKSKTHQSGNKVSWAH
jgi:hypothetical protein